MTEEIAAAAAAMGAGGDAGFIASLAAAAGAELTARLREGVTAADCGEAFALAGAFLVLSRLCASEGGGSSLSVSAGELSVSAGNAAGQAERSLMLRRQAELLLAPWLKDEGFCILGVEI